MNNLTWINQRIDFTRSHTAHELMQLCHDLAHENVLHGGGPFGALVADKEGVIVAPGVNRVVADHDSTCHAETMAIRAAEQKLQTHDLGANNLVLYTSCSPCYMCFGVVWWSGIKHVYYDLTKQEAQALGFQEGPTSADTWRIAREEKGILLEQIRCDQKLSWRAFNKFKEIGTLY